MILADSDERLGSRELVAFPYIKLYYIIYKYILAHNIYIYMYIYNIICKYTH